MFVRLPGRCMNDPDRGATGTANGNDSDDNDSNGDSSPFTMSPMCPTTPPGPYARDVCALAQGMADLNEVDEGGTMFSEKKTDFHPAAFSAGLPGGIQLSQLPDPRNVREAMAAPDADGWREAMDREMENLRSHDIYELLQRALGMRTLHLRWVLHRKFKNGSFNKNKAYIVARGNH